MKKLFALFLMLGLVMTSGAVIANDDDPTGDSTEQTVATAPDSALTAEPEALGAEETTASTEEAEAPKEEQSTSGYQMIKQRFIEGGWVFMSLVLICLILGLALCIERIITLSLATTNTDKLLAKINDKITSGDVKGAIEVCKSTSGPTAEVLGEGLKRSADGLEAVEKSVVSNGGVQMGLLEKGLVWIGLFIAIAPMLGFMGTVLGMIGAFDSIVEAGELSATAIAGDIKVALLTTVFGLIVAIILQIFYNYIVAKVDSLVNRMEDASISLVDILLDNASKIDLNAEK